jgi:hypothetical protein
MVYVEVTYDVEVEGHWIGVLAVLHANHHHLGQFEHAHVEKVWAERIGHHEVLYQFHIKTGSFPHHDHFTVLADARHGSFNVLQVVKGHSTLF